MVDVSASTGPERDANAAVPPEQAAVVIVGGGIAGLASAWQLGELGVRDVVLCEAEDELAQHASARNAGIFLPLEESLTAVWLASRSRDLLDSRIGTSWLWAQGVTLCAAKHDGLDELKFTARRLGVYHEHWGRDELARGVPSLRDGECIEALHLPLGGFIDTKLVLARMRLWAERAGVRILRNARVAAIEVDRARIRGVRLEDGRRIESERVVIAAGAWGSVLGKQAGSPLELTPHRRHLVQLKGTHMPAPRSPIAWRIDEAVYIRPDAVGALVSPCDETPDVPGEPAVDQRAIEGMNERLSRLAPNLTRGSTVDRVWACLRTMSQDRELAVGPDGRVKGLYWCAALGGKGMTCGAAAGELLARGMLGLAHPLAKPLSPERFL